MQKTRFTRRAFLETAAASAAFAAFGKTFSAIGSEHTLKKALVVTMLPKAMGYPDRFQLARRAGFDGIEMRTVSDPSEVEAVQSAAEQSGLIIHSVMNSDHWKYPFSSSDPATVEKGIRGMETSLRNAKRWGAGVVLLVPGVVNPETPYRDAYERSQKQVRKLIPLAKELGVAIAVENVWNKFLLSPLEFIRYVDAFDSRWVRAYFDVGNIVLYGFPQDWIRTLGKRIVRIHLKDFKSDTRQFVPLREGSVNWPEVRMAIAGIGYTGFLTAEVEGGDEASLTEVAGRMDLIADGK